MPYKSEAQRRYFNSEEGKAKIGSEEVEHWNEVSKGKELPEKVEDNMFKKTMDKAIKLTKDEAPNEVLENVAKRTKIDKKYIKQRTLGNGQIEFTNTAGVPIAMYNPRSHTTFFYVIDEKTTKDAAPTKTRDKSGIHYITYKDIDGETVKEKIKGTPDDVNKRTRELREHDCKILKTEMFVNWKDAAPRKAKDATYRVVEVKTGKPMRGGSDFTSEADAEHAIRSARAANITWGSYFPEGGYKVIKVKDAKPKRTRDKNYTVTFRTIGPDVFSDKYHEVIVSASNEDEAISKVLHSKIGNKIIGRPKVKDSKPRRMLSKVADSKIVKVEKGNISKYLILKGKRDDIIRVESNLSTKNQGIPEYFQLKGENKDFQIFENNGWKVKIAKDSKPKKVKDGQYKDVDDILKQAALTTDNCLRELSKTGKQDEADKIANRHITTLQSLLTELNGKTQAYQKEVDSAAKGIRTAIENIKKYSKR